MPIEVSGREVAGALLAVSSAAAAGWMTWRLAGRLFAGQTPLVRLCTAIVMAWAGSLALFWVLIGAGLFHAWSLAAAAVAALVSARALGATDGAQSLSLPAPRGLELGAVVAATLVFGMHALRALIAPCMGRDSMTYHLLKAGRWVQAGEWASESAPDAWRYYEHFPVGGDVLWAWGMLPMSSSTLVPVAEIAVLGVLVVATTTLGLELGATPAVARLAAASLVMVPSISTTLGTAYVDAQLVALFALASLFLLRLAAGSSHREALLALPALSLMVAVKPSAAPVALLGAGLTLVYLVRRRLSRREWLVLLAGSLAAAALAAPSYLRAWVLEGSPLYPFAGPGSERTFDWELAPRLLLEGPWEVIARLLWQPTREGAFLNPGLGALLMTLGALATLAFRLGPRAARLWLGGAMAATVLLVLHPSGSMMLRTVYVETFGRFLGPGIAASAALASLLPRVPARWLLATATLIGSFQGMPRGWEAGELKPLLVLIVGLGLCAGGLRAASRAPTRARWAWVGMVLVAALIGLQHFRDAVRYQRWAAAARPTPAYFLGGGRLHPVYSNAWGLWRAMDQRQGKRLAIVAGWDGIGHNWYRYPFLGSRLQNEVVYVPISADGSIIDMREAQAATAAVDREAWMARLLAAEIDVVVTLAPRTTPEESWMAALPDLFPVVAGDLAGFHRARWVDREAVADCLARHRGACEQR